MIITLLINNLIRNLVNKLINRISITQGIKIPDSVPINQAPLVVITKYILITQISIRKMESDLFSKLEMHYPMHSIDWIPLIIPIQT